MHMNFHLMNEEDARTIRGWRYEETYATYNVLNESDDFTEQLDRRSPHYAVKDEHGKLLGFFAFGTSALVWDYDEPALYSEGQTLDIGLGLRPDLTGKGFGPTFVQAGLDFAKETFAPRSFRLFVLSFNKRAIRTYEKVGFRLVRTFQTHNIHGEHEFVEMRLS